MFEIINQSSIVTTDSSAFNPSTSATPQDLITPINVSELAYDYLWLRTLISIEQTGTSQAQTLTINILDGTTVVKVYTFKTYASLKYDILPVEMFLRKNTKGAIKVQLAQASNNDAQTSIIVKTVMLVGID